MKSKAGGCLCRYHKACKGFFVVPSKAMTALFYRKSSFGSARRLWLCAESSFEALVKRKS